MSSTERQRKLEFAAELLRRAEAGRKQQTPNAWQGLLALMGEVWRPPKYVYAVILGLVAIVGAFTLFQMWSAGPTEYVAINLDISTAERAEGATPERVKLPSNTGLRVTLNIPENARGAKDYVARLAGGSDLKTEQRTDKTITVIIPAGSLPPGTYAIQLFKDTDRIFGSYYFAVE